MSLEAVKEAFATAFSRGINDWPSADANANWSAFTKPDEFVWELGTTPFSDVTFGVRVAFSYLAVIWLLQMFMKNRQAMELKWLFFLHNVVLCAFSLFVTVGVLLDIFNLYTAAPQSAYDTFFCSAERNPIKGRFYWWCWLYYLSKYYELLDTVFQALKKKNIIFLHVYHHFIMIFTPWLGLQGGYVFALWVGVLFNSFVHVVMYYYYALAIFVKKIWWKKYVTKLQLVQFVTGIMCSGTFFLVWATNWRYTPENPFDFTSDGYTAHIPFFTFTQNCAGEVWAVIPMNMVNVSFLFLFSNFFNKTYNKAGKAGGAGAKSGGGRVTRSKKAD